MNTEPKVDVKRIVISLCAACLEGEGDECHTPGCALWMHNSPGHPIAPELYDVPPDSRPTVVCLCGSTRFSGAFQEANLSETLAGRIVLSIGCNMRSDDEIFGGMSIDELRATKERLDALHKRKIELADEILVLNVGGYIGESTRSEIEHAQKLGRAIRYLEPQSPAA